MPTMADGGKPWELVLPLLQLLWSGSRGLLLCGLLEPHTLGMSWHIGVLFGGMGPANSGEGELSPRPESGQPGSPA